MYNDIINCDKSFNEILTELTGNIIDIKYFDDFYNRFIYETVVISKCDINNPKVTTINVHNNTFQMKNIYIPKIMCITLKDETNGLIYNELFQGKEKCRIKK